MDRRPLGLVTQAAELLLITVVAYLLIQTFVAQPFRVEQSSMEATLEQGQYILVDKLTPRFGGYSRGDIVVFTPEPGTPGTDGTPFVKRVVGQAGDVVEIHDGIVWIDGQPLDESSYVFRNEPTMALTHIEARWEVPDDALFVLGDHRTDSTDSRSPRIGLVPVDNVIGRAVLRYWPVPDLAVLQPPAYAQPATSSGSRAIAVPGGDSP